MPDRGRVRRRPAVLGHREGQQGQAPPAGRRAGARVLRLRRRARPAQVTFVTRSGCTLCAEARPVVERLAAEAGVPCAVVDVDTDPALRAQWTDHVPVVLLDGAEHSRWFVDETALAKALQGR